MIGPLFFSLLRLRLRFRWNNSYTILRVVILFVRKKDFLMLTTSDCGIDASDAAFDSACDFDVWFTRDFSSPHDYDYNTSVNEAQCSKPQAVLWSSYDGNLTLINLLDTKFSCFTSLPTQHQKLKVSTSFVSCKIILEDRRRIVDESTKEPY